MTIPSAPLRHVRRFAVAIALAISAVPGDSSAGPWPERTVRIIVPAAAGNSFDIAARLFAERLAALWGKPVITENRPGADGILGVQALQHANDGHTLLFGFPGIITAVPLLHQNLPYDPSRDLVPISSVYYEFLCIAVPAGLPVATLSDLVQLAKSQPDRLNWSSPAGAPYLTFPANDEGKVYTTDLSGRLVHKLDAPTAAIDFEEPQIHDYFLGGGNFSPTAVEYHDGLYYVTTGYCNLDYVLTARVSKGSATWNDLAFGGKGEAHGQFGTAHGITKPPDQVRLDIADRPHSRLERFTRYGRYLSTLEMPSGSLPCDINYLDHKYSVVPALEGPDKTKGAPIYVMENEKIVSTIMIKEDLGLPNFTHIHNAAIRKIGNKFYIMALAWNPGDFAILEQV